VTERDRCLAIGVLLAGGAGIVVGPDPAVWVWAGLVLTGVAILLTFWRPKGERDGS